MIVCDRCKKPLDYYESNKKMLEFKRITDGGHDFCDCCVKQYAKIEEMINAYRARILDEFCEGTLSAEDLKVLME